MNNSGSKVVIEAMANNAFESLLCKHHVELTNHVSIKQLEGCFKIKFYYLNNDSNENFNHLCLKIIYIVFVNKVKKLVES